MKKILISIILFAILLSLVSCTGDNMNVHYEYRLNDDLKSYSIKNALLLISTEVVIPSTHNGLPVTNIDDKAFYGCDLLKSVVIPNSVKSIGKFAFAYCNNLTSIEIPDSVTNIGDYAFKNCNLLTRVEIGDSVNSIGHRAFEDCPSLVRIEVDNNNEHYKSIDGNLYTKNEKKLIQYAVGKKATSFTIPNSVTSIASMALSDCIWLTNIDISNENGYYKSVDGNLYTKDGKKLIQYAVAKQDSTFTIPDSVEQIDHRAFRYCDKLSIIKISDSVQIIGTRAFEHCTSLSNIVIPDSVTTIGNSAFENCYSLKSVIIGDSVTSIGDLTFAQCFLLSNVIIGECVTKIEDYAFFTCNALESIVIPESVTSIGDGAFSGCALLKSINYDGTKGQWNAIDKGKEWKFMAPATEVICSNGTVSLK